jgi:hypothetical protein
MSIDPSLEPPRWVTPLRGVGAWCAILVALLSGSCFFDLPPLSEDLSTIGGSAGFDNVGGSLPTAGSSGDPGGSTGTGGSAGNSGSSGCPVDGQKLCNGQCVPASPQNGCGNPDSCEPCGSAQHAVVGCQEGQCAVLGCDPGFADCDGDTLAKTGVPAGTGCEYQLGLPAASVPTLSVPLRHITVDGHREDWNGVASYTFDKTCNNCRDQQTPAISAEGTVPPREDLDARFRVAWDADKFYVLVEAFDNQPYDAAMEGNGCQQAADCEDAVQVFFAGRQQTHNYFNDNQRLFLGLSQRVGAPGQGQPGATDVEIKSERQGNLCYRIEAQVDWAYITSIKNVAPDPAYFPAAPGNSYGFDIALNDWDAPISDPNAIQRQSQIFWLDPGPSYAEKPDQIGTMQLLGGGDAGQ